MIFLLPFIIIFGIGIALLIVAWRAKDRPVGVVVWVMGAVLITLSLVSLGGCLLVARGLRGMM